MGMDMDMDMDTCPSCHHEMHEHCQSCWACPVKLDGTPRMVHDEDCGDESRIVFAHYEG